MTDHRLTSALRPTILLAAALAASACAHATNATNAMHALARADGVTWQSPSSADEAAIRATFDTTAAGWNRGDLAAYMSAYVDSATGNGAGGFDMGKAAIERTMRAGFWRTGKPAQQLRYRNLRVRMLGADYALVNGEFVLSGADRPERTGLFSTVWVRTRAGWRMMNDHSG